MKFINRHYLIWSLLGIFSVPSLWYAWSLPGAIGMFSCIGMAFVLWHFLGSKGSWLALVIIGFGMGSILGWQTVTGARCPKDNTKVFLKVDKPPVGCNEMRASSGSMAVLFVFIAGLGIGAPIYGRSIQQDGEVEKAEDADIVG